MKRFSVWKKSAIVLVALAILVFASLGALAAEWEYPTAPMEVDKNVITIGAHAAASCLPEFLGANLTTARTTDFINGSTDEEIFANAVNNGHVGIFGTNVNANPNPYIWNFFYNCYAATKGLPLSGDVIWAGYSGSPTAADTTIIPEWGTSGTLYMRPDVLLGTGAAKDGTNYDTLLADLPENKDSDPNNDYAPPRVVYAPQNTMTTIQTVHNTAAAMEQVMAKTGKVSRYKESPTTIAVDYENFIRGTQYYVLAKLNGARKKTIAVISPTDLGDGTFNAYTSNISSGTASSVRGGEYTELTTNNLVDVLGLENQNGTYKVKAADLLKADVIFIAGGQGGSGSADKDAFISLLVDKYGLDAKKVMSKPIFAKMPDTVFGIVMNSCENAIGYPLFQGFQYYEETGLNPVYFAAYYYEKFYHLSDPDTIANCIATMIGVADLPKGVTTSLAGYSYDAVEDMLLVGMKYYKEHETEYNDTRWAWNINTEVGVGTKLVSKVDALTDIAGHWAYSDIAALVARGMFNGMTATTFEPDTTMSKGMILTAMYRYDGASYTKAPTFSDVAAGLWYSEPIAWAANAGIAAGKADGTFGPNENISREELASVIYNYAVSKGMNVANKSDLSVYADKGDVSSKYLTAVKWCVGNGIISGQTNAADAAVIAPAATATRAEVVSMLNRFLALVK